MKPSFAAVLLVGAMLALPASAQFVGPLDAGTVTTVSEAGSAATGTYVTLEGRISRHLGEDYYLFGDASGEIRVEIEPGVFAGREVTPETALRLEGEVDRNLVSGRYVWVSGFAVLD